jgi:hypothetical protein
MIGESRAYGSIALVLLRFRRVRCPFHPDRTNAITAHGREVSTLTLAVFDDGKTD